MEERGVEDPGKPDHPNPTPEAVAQNTKVPSFKPASQRHRLTHRILPPVLLGIVAAAMLEPSRFDLRDRDWRNGAVVYQIFVDRFVPPVGNKQSLYPTPLRPWTETPKATAFDSKLQTYPHVIEFWGGDLAGVRTKIDYIEKLGADTVYLLPIFKAPSNHKYDTENYHAIDPQYGTMTDLKGLLTDLHRRGMRLMLDGVFNHVGVTSALFKDPAKKDWFYFGKEYPLGYRGWAGVASLPAFRLENSKVQDYLWQDGDSVVQRYLKMGIDGWRLDVAFELGPSILESLTKAAHDAKPGSAVVGEISGYPAGWSGAVDGVFNFLPVAMGRSLLEGGMTGGQAGRALGHLVEDAGIEPLLKSWLLAENHDTPRLASLVKDPNQRRLVTALQFLLPGSPCVYYGEELGMEGTGDPENRAPMRWDRVNGDNPDYEWLRRLAVLRKSHLALRIGDFTPLDTNRLLAFARTTDKVREATIVVINPTAETIKESFPTRVGKLMSWGELEDGLSLQRIRSVNGMMTAELPPHGVAVYGTVDEKNGGYSPYDRIP